jgi:Ca2+-binding RTX toxin-like protein
LQGGAGEDYFDGGGGYDIAAFVEIAPGAQIEGIYGYTGLTFTTAYTLGDLTSTYTVYNPDTGVTETVVNVEEIWASNYNDIMIGGDGADNFVGARGDDMIIGNAGQDVLYGSLDNDVIYAGNYIGDVQDIQGGTGTSSSDGESDTLVFLRYNTDGITGNPDLVDQFPLGDGNDVVYNFDVGFGDGHDTIEFFGNETISPHLDYDVTGGDTVITYAIDSTITLKGVEIATLAEIDIVEDIDPLLFG